MNEANSDYSEDPFELYPIINIGSKLATRKNLKKKSQKREILLSSLRT